MEMTKIKESNLERQPTCPSCGSVQLIKDKYRGELVCDECGLVIEEDLIDYRPEWRAFDSEQREQRAHTGPPVSPTLHDKGLTTVIGWQNRDSYGRTIPNKNKSQVYRLRKWQKRIRLKNAAERNLAQAFATIVSITSKMGLPRIVRENAALIYRQAANNDLIRGRSIDSVAAASVYAACRQCSVPRSLDELCTISGISKKEIGRNHRFLSRELRLKLKPLQPQDYVARFCNRLNLNPDVQRKAIEILNRARDHQLNIGQNPVSVAAGSIYIASVLCGDRKTQKEVATESGVTEVTIRNRYKELTEKLNIVLEL
jgi:transcription initiation factor TFIIB